jgi:hypothetical protein
MGDWHAVGTIKICVALMITGCFALSLRPRFAAIIFLRVTGV